MKDLLTISDEELVKVINEYSPENKSIQIALQNQQEEIKRLQSLVYVPGVKKCAKCSCVVYSTSINMTSGAFSANNKPEQCPNGCGPMWMITERDSREQSQESFVVLFDENRKLKESNDKQIKRLRAKLRKFGFATKA